MFQMQMQLCYQVICLQPTGSSQVVRCSPGLTAQHVPMVYPSLIMGVLKATSGEQGSTWAGLCVTLGFPSN